VFYALRNFIQACNTLGRYGLVLESNEEIYQQFFEPLFKELKVGDDISHDLHDTNSNSTCPKKTRITLDYE
jgi:hypothetical protein